MSGFLVSAGVYVCEESIRPADVILTSRAKPADIDAGLLHQLIDIPGKLPVFVRPEARPQVPLFAFQDNTVTLLAQSEMDTTASGNARFWADSLRPGMPTIATREVGSFRNIEGTPADVPSEVGNIAFASVFTARPVAAFPVSRGTFAQYPSDYPPLVPWALTWGSRPSIVTTGRAEFTRPLADSGVTLPDVYTLSETDTISLARPLPSVPAKIGDLAFPAFGWNLGPVSIQMFWQGFTARPIEVPSSRPSIAGPSPQQDIPITVLTPESSSRPQNYFEYVPLRGAMSISGFALPNWPEVMSFTVSGPFVVLAAQVTWFGAAAGEISTQ